MCLFRFSLFSTIMREMYGSRTWHLDNGTSMYRIKRLASMLSDHCEKKHNQENVLKAKMSHEHAVYYYIAYKSADENMRDTSCVVYYYIAEQIVQQNVII